LNYDTAIDLKDLTKDYTTRRALDRVSFTVGRGEIFGYIGANGAGKTTTIKILTGLTRPSFGDAVVLGRSVLTHPLQVKAAIGYLPESGAVFEKLSAREYLTAIGYLYKMSGELIQAQVEKWLAYFGLRDRADERLGTFSKGTRQKICWVGAVMHDPEVLILDEPLTGLDAETIARIKDLMKDYVSSGKTIFYSSHLIEIMEKICSRIAVLHRGRLVGVGSIDEMRTLFDAPELEQALMKFWQGQD
jgi:ABC-2 type transport system ATP-binding protein